MIIFAGDLALAAAFVLTVWLILSLLPGVREAIDRLLRKDEL